MYIGVLGQTLARVKNVKARRDVKTYKSRNNHSLGQGVFPRVKRC